MPKIDKKRRSRAYCFTSFDKDPPIIDKKKAKYYIIGSEICPDTKKHHWQCYVHYVNAISWSKFKKMYPSHHFEQSRGSAEDNKKYCSKEKVHEEWGDLPRQGKRSDIEELYLLAKDGGSEDTAWDEFGVAMMRYERGFKSCRENYRRRQKGYQKMEVICLWGPTRSGKSSLFRTIYGDDLPMPSVAGPLKVWFDEYTGDQDTILFDDYYGGIEYSYLLRILDGYPFNLPTKGGFIWKRYKRVLFTSNVHPRNWDSWTPALKARFTYIGEVRDSITRTSVQKDILLLTAQDQPKVETLPCKKSNDDVEHIVPDFI